jgi:hypothetical protein
MSGSTGPTAGQGDEGDTFIDSTSGDLYIKGPTGWYVDGSVSGPTGNKGSKGPTGPKGPTGLRGPQGAQGIQDIQGVQGAQGIQGIQGEKGDKGDKGATGNGITSTLVTGGILIITYSNGSTASVG